LVTRQLPDQLIGDHATPNDQWARDSVKQIVQLFDTKSISD